MLSPHTIWVGAAAPTSGRELVVEMGGGDAMPMVSGACNESASRPNRLRVLLQLGTNGVAVRARHWYRKLGTT